MVGGGVGAAPAGAGGPAESAFVGRAGELAVLGAAWRRAQGEGRQIVLVAGEPGIGKTTLAVRTAEQAWAQGAVVLFGRCDEEAVTPFQPFVEAVSHYVETVDPERLRSDAGARRRRRWRCWFPPSAGGCRSWPASQGTGAETERYRILEAVATLFDGIGAEGPLVVVLDDLHWADRPSLQLLKHVIRRCAATPLLLLGTYRDTDLVRTHPMAETLSDLRRADLVTRVPLRGLTADDVAALVAGGGRAEDADVALAGRVVERDRRPAVSCARSCATSPRPAPSRDDKGGTGRCAGSSSSASPSVREVIGRQLTRLSEAANTGAADRGSVMGREIRLDVFERVTDLGAARSSRSTKATAAGVVDEVPGGTGRWAFTHALVRQALYDELSLTRRVRLHQRVGEALEAIHGGGAGPHLAELAFHFTQAAVAGTADKAIGYARRAGELRPHARRLRNSRPPLRDGVRDRLGSRQRNRADGAICCWPRATPNGGRSLSSPPTYDSSALSLCRPSDADRLAQTRSASRRVRKSRPAWTEMGARERAGRSCCWRPPLPPFPTLTATCERVCWDASPRSCTSSTPPSPVAHSRRRQASPWPGGSATLPRSPTPWQPGTWP